MLLASIGFAFIRLGTVDLHRNVSEKSALAETPILAFNALQCYLHNSRQWRPRVGCAIEALVSWCEQIAMRRRWIRIISAVACTGAILRILSSCHRDQDGSDDYRERLIGTWRRNETVPGAPMGGTTRYLVDGTTISSAVVMRGSKSYQLEAAGRWSLNGKRISYVVESSNLPDLLPIGTRTFDDIVELTDDRLTYQTRSGARVTLQRVRDAAPR
jgi:hypothetical protein